MTVVRFAPSPTGHLHVGNIRLHEFNIFSRTIKTEFLKVFLMERDDLTLLGKRILGVSLFLEVDA